jgi:hypothetical protein
MKRFRNRIIISILTFALGVSAVAIWLVKFKSDPKIYSVEFCDLMRESKNYDGKIIEIQVSYEQWDHGSVFTDSNCKELVNATSSLGEESWKKVFNSLHESLERKEKITVIGRYHDSEYRRHWGYRHEIDILEVKPVNTLKIIK